jgi:hypothetical protein
MENGSEHYIRDYNSRLESQDRQQRRSPSVHISSFSPLPGRSIAEMQLSPSFFLLRGTFISRLLLAAGMVYIYRSEIHTIARRMLTRSTLAIEGWEQHRRKQGVLKMTICARSTQKVARSPCTMKKHTPSSSR